MIQQAQPCRLPVVGYISADSDGHLEGHSIDTMIATESPHAPDRI